MLVEKILVQQCYRFQILITGGSSGLVETMSDAVSVHSIKKALYARRLTEGRLGTVSLLDYFINVSDLHPFIYTPILRVNNLHGFSLMEIHRRRSLLVLKGTSSGH